MKGVFQELKIGVFSNSIPPFMTKPEQISVLILFGPSLLEKEKEPCSRAYQHLALCTELGADFKFMYLI